jgi:ABC-type sugar transport system ATPase subunit
MSTSVNLSGTSFKDALPRLELRDVSSEYVEKKNTHTIALLDVSFVLPEGSFTVVMGPSGCGKSTLLRCIMGFQDYGGTILLNGNNIEDIKISDRHIAYIPQTRVLYATLTVFDNIAFPLRAAHYPSEQIRSRVQEISKLLDLDLLLTRKPHQLSGGQQQKVALARALVGFSDTILMDEPYTDLDDRTRVAMYRILKDLQKKMGLTVLFVTHQAKEASTLADRLIVMEKGKVIQQGAFMDVYRSPLPLTRQLLYDGG